jgi:acyl-CoA reductase-like NAD-dependent aldehyde dehydrogenase
MKVVPDDAEPKLAALLHVAGGTGLAWRQTPLRERLRIITRARRLLAIRAAAVAATWDDRRPRADTLTAEILPLLASMRFLERRAARILAPRRLRGGRPLWLLGVTAELHREPRGVVLILGPSNYPLFLPGAQIAQALAAGNAVCAKPAPGCAGPLEAFAAILAEAGLPEGVLQVLDDTIATGAAAASAAFDLILLTGSAETGRSVLAASAPRLTPATMELSGNDAVFVLPAADIDAVAAALAYGMRLNSGATCIAPRRVFVLPQQAERLASALLARIARLRLTPPPPIVASRLERLVAEAIADGARLLHGAEQTGAVILVDARPEMRLLREDVFAPWLAFVPVADMAEAIAAQRLCPYALGASIFGPEPEARAMAGYLQVGSVCINDLIVPTADPRLPFGGRGLSGFGVTRGDEGLLDMTVVKTISLRRGRFMPHLAEARSTDADRYAGLILLLYGGPAQTLRAMRGLVRGKPDPESALTMLATRQKTEVPRKRHDA